MMGLRVIGSPQGWVIAFAVGLCSYGCVDGAPKAELGKAKYGASASPFGSAAFAPREAVGAMAGSGAATTLPQGEPDEGGRSAPTVMPAGAGGTAGPALAAGGSGGSAGRSSSMTAGAGGTRSSGAGMGSAGSSEGPGPGSAGTLTITFTSVNQGGRYQPRNVGAVWIETGTGTFVKTIERWAGIRANHLTAWAAASGGWGSFFGGGNTADKMDAISRATLSRHEKHMLTWDMKDLEGQIVPNGKYKVGIEVTEDNFLPGANAHVEFEKGEAAQMVMSPDQDPFSGLVISYQP